jgi:hypothetical protein
MKSLAVLIFCLTLSFSYLAFAQAPTLLLDFENVYLSDVSRNLELDGYQQLFSSTETDKAGTVTQSYTWKSVGVGSEHLSEDIYTMNGQTFVHSSYLIAGAGYDSGSAGTDPPYCDKRSADEYQPLEIETTVSDVTGFHTATLLSADETVNGFQADHYRLEPPVENGYYDPANLQGELWLNRAGGFIVKYVVEGKSPEDGSVARWQYELFPSTDALVLPEACAGL